MHLHLRGVGKERGDVKVTHEAAKACRVTAGLLEQSSVGDVFTTRFGNIPLVGTS